MGGGAESSSLGTSVELVIVYEAGERPKGNKCLQICPSTLSPFSSLPYYSHFRVDAADDYYRIRMVCTLLDTCGKW